MTADPIKSMDALKRLVEVLGPLQSEERSRLIRAAMVFLGEASSVDVSLTGPAVVATVGDTDNLPLRARTWMKQNSLAFEDIEQVFHVSSGVAEVIATHLPGKNKKEQTFSAYIITGIGQLLLTGNASFDDKSARALCEVSGCYDNANHSAYLKDRGNEFSGSKEKGWTLTAPGLKRGADLVRDISKLNA